MNVCLNEDRRLTKNVPLQLFSKPEILVTSHPKALPISHLFHIQFGKMFNNNI